MYKKEKIMKFLFDKYFKKTDGFYPFFKYCPNKYKNYYFCLRASRILGYKYNWETPKTLNEKIRWLIYNENLELKSKLTDKILVKGYIASRIGNNHCAEIYGIYNSIDEIDFSILPDRFVLKANHGCRMNVFVKNKKFIYKNYKDLKTITSRWLKTNYEDFSLEPQYKNINRKLFIESMRNSDNDIKDLSIYCFNGKPLFCEIKNTPYENKAYVQFYSTKWKLQDFTHTWEYNSTPIKEPPQLDVILEYAEILSKDFSFIRIDFSYDADNIHVVELTFTPCSAIIPFKEIRTDYLLGEKLIIPKKGI